MSYGNIWLLPLLLYGGMATAAPTAEALADYRSASERFSTRIAEAEAGGKATQLRGGDFGALVEALSDERALLVEGPYSSGEVETDIEICGIANKTTMSLVLFDLKASLAPLQDPQARAVEFEALMTRNTLLFQDELMALQPFLFRCLAKQMRGMERFFASLPPEQFTDVRRSGLAKMRKGVLMVFQGGLSIAGEAVFSEVYRDALLSALADSAEAYASVMPLSERMKIVDMMTTSASAKHGRYGAYIERIERAFRSEACSALCAIE